MEALLKAMQATPGLQPFSGYWNQLLWWVPQVFPHGALPSGLMV
jgi:hypothetical protein